MTGWGRRCGRGSILTFGVHDGHDHSPSHSDTPLNRNEGAP